MRFASICGRVLGFGAMALGPFVLAAPASAQWTRVTDVPPTRVYSLWADGDTIAAGVDSTTYVSTNAGVTWLHSATPVADARAIEAVLIRNGLLYAGTFDQGVFLSNDLGATWQAYNQGLVGGILDSQLDLSDFEVRGDSLYAATLGAGVYVRSLAGPSTWHPFGDAFEPNQAANVNDLALGGTRLLAAAGSNGMVFFRDPGDADWNVSNLDNVGIHPGLQSQTVAWTGTGWAVGTVAGVFRSVSGEEPWTLTNPQLGPVIWTALATQGPRLFAAFDIPNFCVIEQSDDDGATFQILDVLPAAFVEQMVVSGTHLYAARENGLWRRSTEITSVAPGVRPGNLRFAIAGPQPLGDQARLRFELPEPGVASIEVFDVLGRRAGDRTEAWWSSGAHEVSLDARGLVPGVYAARLTAGGRTAVARFVRLR
jgi:hypothetical protein